MKKIAEIYAALFDKQIKLVKRKRKNEQGYKLEFADSVVARCLHKIGVPFGDKILTKFEVPSWILCGNKKIKQKFIQALFDDELEGLYKDKNHTNSWKGLRLRMNKSEKLIPSALTFFNQIISLLKQFNIESTPVKVYNTVSYVRDDQTKTYTIVFRVRNNVENRKRFLKEIGFIYDQRKQQQLIQSIA